MPNDNDFLREFNRTRREWDDAKKPEVLITPAWKDISIKSFSLGQGVNAPTQGPWVGNLQMLRFTGVSIQINELFSDGEEIPHGYVEGTDIYFHVHWVPVNGTAGNVRWYLDYTWANVNAVFPVPTTINVIDAAAGTAWTHQKAEFAAVSGAGKRIGSAVGFRLYRNPADAGDTYAYDAGLLHVGIHYMADELGSRTITSKG